ncbi:helix-turn-helix transcriptional regulator [Actinocorallia lasiicapitis]
MGEFLRSRRARLKPEDVALPRYGERRRVPGLRREELAQLAGLSVDYYIRFEQGRSDNISTTIIDAVATALRLDPAERSHLHNLSRALRPPTREEPPQSVRPGLLRLLNSIKDTPAVVIGRRTDLLAWNPLFTQLFFDLSTVPKAHRNKAYLFFTDESVRSRYVNWQDKASDLVAYLRLDLGRHPGDPTFPKLIAALSNTSPDFQALWSAHEVRDKTHGTYRFHHPVAGEFPLTYETLRLPDDPDQALVTYAAAPGTPAESALKRIATSPPPAPLTPL